MRAIQPKPVFGFVPDWRPSRGTRIVVGLGAGLLALGSAWIVYRMVKGRA